MAWNGYFEYGGDSQTSGIEIFNVHRVGNYASRFNLEWFRGCGYNDQLACLLGCEDDYRNPIVDEAPWLDPDNNSSANFLGAWPIDVTGLEDSTREANVVESTGDGGVPGRLRHRTRTIVFSAALIATTECGLDYGMEWLKRSLDSPLCGDGCNGGDLVYLSCEPCEGNIPCVHCGREDVESTAYTTAPGGDPQDPNDVTVTHAIVPGTDIEPGTDVDECLRPYLRTLHNVTITNGPVIDAKYELSDGAHLWIVTFTAVAGDPFPHGEPVAIVEDFMGPDEDPYAEDVDGDADEIGYNITDSDTDCTQASFAPLYDPLCKPAELPPAPPTVLMSCYEPQTAWTRRSFTVDKQYIPTFGDVDPVFKLKAEQDKGDIRNIRVRIWEDFFDRGNPENEPCGYCTDFIVSYIPDGNTLVIDGEYRRIYVEDNKSQVQRRADSLVFSTDQTPFEWPALTCGSGYTVTVDMDRTATNLPIMSLDLVGRN